MRPSHAQTPAAAERRRGIASAPLDAHRVGVLLGEWQRQEVRLASGFHECRGLPREQLEDLYQETSLALLSRPYLSEEHLRNALRTGVKQRALRLHRDQRRRTEILEQNAPGLRLAAEGRADLGAPETVTLVKQDRLIATEFLAELTPEERRIFRWLVEGYKYRAIASALKIPVDQARRAERSCARKLERFQLLYETGRLCGFRARTIQALQDGRETSEELAGLAFAHLESCPHCRAEHKTNATQLRQRFRDQAASLLPPILVGRIGWISKHALRIRALLDRLGIDMTASITSGPRERAVTLIAGTGTVVKVAAGLVAVGVLAGGAVASHDLSHQHPYRHHSVDRSSRSTTSISGPPPVLIRPLRASAGKDSGQHHAARRPHQRRHSGVQQLDPGGFGYLGIPQTRRPNAQAVIASAAEQQQGGPFSP